MKVVMKQWIIMKMQLIFDPLKPKLYSKSLVELLVHWVGSTKNLNQQNPSLLGCCYHVANNFVLQIYNHPIVPHPHITTRSLAAMVFQSDDAVVTTLLFVVVATLCTGGSGGRSPPISTFSV